MNFFKKSYATAESWSGGEQGRERVRPHEGAAASNISNLSLVQISRSLLLR